MQYCAAQVLMSNMAPRGASRTHQNLCGALLMREEVGVNIRRLIETVREMRSLPEVEVQMWGGQVAQESYLAFTKPHPRYRFIQRKRWGVGLLPLPASFEEYLNGSDKAYLRRKRRLALGQGLSFGVFTPMERLEEIMLINASKPTRQGKSMDPCYLDMEQLGAFFGDKHTAYGVFDQRGVVRAYAWAPLLGEAFSFDRLLGHADDLEKGIMYLLVSETIREMIEHKAEHGLPLWAMYDTFFGAHPGLRQFKERTGFRPYKVRWVWQGESPAQAGKGPAAMPV